jgi:hypothetical protein
MLFKGLRTEIIQGMKPSNRHPLDALLWQIHFFKKRGRLSHHHQSRGDSVDLLDFQSAFALSVVLKTHLVVYTYTYKSNTYHFGCNIHIKATHVISVAT